MAQAKKAHRIVDPLADFEKPVEEAVEELTPEQQRIKELEHQLAVLAGKKEAPPVEYEAPENPGSGENVLIHFVKDGFTWGRVWMRGQELEFDPNTAAYKETFGRDGKSWTSFSEDEQIERYGDVYFKPGPWTGKTYLDAKFEVLKKLGADSRVEMPSLDELERAQKAEFLRRRAAPRLPTM